jgi:hypothetical protein
LGDPGFDSQTWDVGAPRSPLGTWESNGLAAQVAAALALGGLWLSLIGSTEGSLREVGPPRRSAQDVVLAIEPALEIVELRAAEFRGHGASAWFCLSRKRTFARNRLRESTDEVAVVSGECVPGLGATTLASKSGEFRCRRTERFSPPRVSGRGL